MALKLWKTAYKNIKRDTPRARPESKYYVVFDWKNPYLGSDPKKKKYRIPIGHANFALDEPMKDVRERGLLLMAEAKMPPAPVTEVVTLEEGLEAHLKHISHLLEPPSLARHHTCNRMIMQGLGKETPLTDITPEMIVSWIQRRRQSVTNGTINKDLSTLRGMLTWARKKKQWIKADPMDDITNLDVPDGRTRYLYEDEIPRLWSVSSRWLWRMIWFACLTGLRQGEQLSLRWSQIQDGQIRLKGKTNTGEGTKGKKPRYIPLIPDLITILEEVRGDHPEFVFVTPHLRRKISKSNFSANYWKPAREAAGLKDFRWHDLRHTFCSWVVRRGGELPKLQKLAGHSNYRTTQIYTHLEPEHLVDTINLLDGIWTPPADVTPIRSARAK